MSSFLSNPIRLAGSFALALAAVNTAAAQTAPLSAAESDPRVLGWMQGFPPPPDKLIMQPSSNYFSFPKLRWSVCHIRELMPTKVVSRGLGEHPSIQLDVMDWRVSSNPEGLDDNVRRRNPL